MKKVYIVSGSTGEYSDRSDWPIAVLDSEEDAKSLVRALTDQYLSIPQNLTNDRWDHEDEIKSIMTLDPNFSMDYTGTRYFYESCESIATAELVEKIAMALTSAEGTTK